MSGNFVDVCSFCQRVIDDNGDPVCPVYSRDLPDGVTFSHGCCNECLADQRAELQRQKQGRAELALATDLVRGKYRVNEGGR